MKKMCWRISEVRDVRHADLTRPVKNYWSSYQRTNRGRALELLALRNFHHLFGREDHVDDGIEEDAEDANGAAEELHELERLAHDERHADDHDYALGRVGHRLRERVGLLDGHGRELVVAVEAEAREHQVVAHVGVGLHQLDEVTELAALLGEHEREAHEEGDGGGEGELVAHAADALRDARAVHELLVLVALDGRKRVGRAGRHEG
mmetsp:Transcript_3248/g.7508  ORF Transcript_3248/g.7508 Transcript_3248/m.7508 type:complete len:207 (+) Transcript_3248:164-784(+)